MAQKGGRHTCDLDVCGHGQQIDSDKSIKVKKLQISTIVITARKNAFLQVLSHFNKTPPVSVLTRNDFSTILSAGRLMTRLLFACTDIT